LQAIYPEHKWLSYNPFKFGHITEQRGSKSQALLLSTLKSLLPQTSILANYRFPKDSIGEQEKALQYYELDVSIRLVYRDGIGDSNVTL
jgi:hypothetical protein